MLLIVMTRKEFLEQVGISAALLLAPACISGLSSCKKKQKSKPKVIDFTLDVSTGALSVNGGALVNESIIVARTLSGAFIAIDAACSHEGTTINFVPSSTSFKCPAHGAQFDSGGNVTVGPASTKLQSYNTSLSGTSLRVFS